MEDYYYCCTLKNLYSAGNNEVKDEILRAACWNFSIANGEIVSIQYKKPFDLIAKLPKNADFVDWWTIWDYVGTFAYII